MDEPTKDSVADKLYRGEISIGITAGGGDFKLPKVKMIPVQSDPPGAYGYQVWPNEDEQLQAP